MALPPAIANKRIPDYLIEQFDLPESGWAEATAGIMAITFMNKDTVIQGRHIFDIGRWKALVEYSKLLNDSMFVGIHAEFLLIEDRKFWLKMKRLDSADDYYVYNIGGDHEEWWGTGEEFWPDCLKTLKLLQKSPKLLPATMRARPARGVAYKSIQQEYILEMLRTLGLEESFIKSLPDEPKTKFVNSHGDLGIHNMVYHNQGMRLIDWENLSYAPAGCDLGQYVAYLFSRTPAANWVEHFRNFTSEGAQELTGLNEEEWQRLTVWAVIRETATWLSRDYNYNINFNVLDENVRGIKLLLKEL